MSQLNLIPDHYLNARRRRRQLCYGVVGLAVVAALVTGWVVLALGHNAKLDQRIAALQQELVPVRDRFEQCEICKGGMPSYKNRNGLIRTLNCPFPSVPSSTCLKRNYLSRWR